MKYIITLFVSLVLFGGIAQAQVCPTGYTCTKIEPVCPVGYTCRKITATVAPAPSQLDVMVTMDDLQKQSITLNSQIQALAKSAPLMRNVDGFYIDIWNQPVTAANYKTKMKIEELRSQLFNIADQMSNLAKFGTTSPMIAQ